MQRLARPGKGQQAEPEALDSSASAASSCQHGLGPLVPLTFPSSLKHFPCQGGPVFHFQSSQTLCLSQEASMGLEKTLPFFRKIVGYSSHYFNSRVIPPLSHSICLWSFLKGRQPQESLFCSKIHSALCVKSLFFVTHFEDVSTHSFTQQIFY